jgi:tryptophan 2,3-dioxygenase
MAKIKFTKVSGILAPFGPEAEAWMNATKADQVIEVEATRPRNSAFHRKYFALLNYAFENWDIPETDGAKNFNRFRDDITILAGFYEKHYRVDRSVRIEAQSISFAKMEQAEFDALYSKTLDILLARILPSHTEDDINQIMAFM